MDATAVGDCDLRVFDQHGHLCILHLKNVLYVPTVEHNLLSTICLGQQGYHFVPYVEKAVFPQGVFLQF